MIKLTHKQMQDMQELIYNEFGIKITENKEFSLTHKLNNLLTKENFKDFDDLYTKLLSGDKDVKETLIRYITTNHTFFFREEDHFESLLSFIQNQNKKEILIWCAASSTGEEPYSIAMTLLDAGIVNFKILASDVDHSVLTEFNNGLYNQERFFKMSKAQKLAYFKRVDENHFKVKPILRQHIIIKKLNLMDDINFDFQFDYIFCRNVFIYFDDISRDHAIQMLTRNLVQGGYLFIGHTETLFNTSKKLKKEGHSIYKKLK